MEEATVLLIVGWAMSEKPQSVLENLLGAADGMLIELSPQEWDVVAPISSEEPIGRPSGVLCLTAVDAAPEAEIWYVPGSQGCSAPASEAVEGVRVVRLRPGQSLLLDARCWFRTGPYGAQAELVVQSPSRVRSALTA